MFIFIIIARARVVVARTVSDLACANIYEYVSLTCARCAQRTRRAVYLREAQEVHCAKTYTSHIASFMRDSTWRNECVPQDHRRQHHHHRSLLLSLYLKTTVQHTRHSLTALALKFKTTMLTRSLRALHAPYNHKTLRAGIQMTIIAQLRKRRNGFDK